MSVLDDLRLIRDRLSDRQSWTQGVGARNRFGDPCGHDFVYATHGAVIQLLNRAIMRIEEQI